jgi:hypothetical protein
MPSVRDLADGFTMTGHFLETHVFADGGRAMPKAREDFARLVQRHTR